MIFWVRIYLGHLLHRLGTLCFRADFWLNPVGIGAECSDGPLFPCPFCPPPGGCVDVE